MSCARAWLAEPRRIKTKASLVGARFVHGRPWPRNQGPRLMTAQKTNSSLAAPATPVRSPAPLPPMAWPKAHVDPINSSSTSTDPQPRRRRPAHATLRHPCCAMRRRWPLATDSTTDSADRRKRLLQTTTASISTPDLTKPKSRPMPNAASAARGSIKARARSPTPC